MIGKNALDAEVKWRKELWLRTDFDVMQEEFRKGGGCKNNVKIINKKKEEGEGSVNNQGVKEVKVDEFFSVIGVEMKKVKGKKKTKDVVTLDIPLGEREEIDDGKVEKTSLFEQRFKEASKDMDCGNIEKETGLPKTFKIDNYENKCKGSYLREPPECTPNKNNNKWEENELKYDKNYKEMTENNLRYLKSWSESELKEDTNTIFKTIPSKLIDKIKSGKLRASIQKALNQLDGPTPTPSKQFPKPTNTEIKHQNLPNQPQEKPLIHDDPIILYNYSGSAKSILPSSPEFEKYTNIPIPDKIDFTHSSFNEMELNSKYFSLWEIYNFISSSNLVQISFGLKTLHNIIIQKMYYKDKDLQKQLYSFINALYYWIDHNNINIRLTSLKIFTFITTDFFNADYKQFRHLTYKWCHFPAHVISTQILDCLKLDETKRQLKQLLCNFNKNFYVLLNQSDNQEIQRLYLTLMFYCTYLSGEFDTQFISQLKKSKTNAQKIFSLIHKERLLKLLLLFSGKDDARTWGEYVRNKFFLKFIYEIRGITYDRSLFSNINCKTTNDKIYELNWRCITYVNLNLKPSEYLRETNWILLSRMIQCKVNYAMKKLGKDNNDDESRIFENESQLKFFEGKYRDCISILNENNSFSDQYYQYTSAFAFISSFLILWHKVFKYPKIVGFKHFTLTLKDIVDDFGTINKTLNNIISIINMQCATDNSSKRDTKIQLIYLYSSFLPLCLNYIRTFIKNHDPWYRINNIELFWINVSTLINKGDEYFFNKYIKYLKSIIYRKYQVTEVHNRLFPDLKIDFSEIDTDLNFYLDSNEDLRKSTFNKKILCIYQNNEKLNTIILKETDYISQGVSKYFPFDSNFITQVIYNSKAKTEVKVNYLAIIILLWYKTSFSETVVFEMPIRFVMSFHLTEFISNTRLIRVFDSYISNILMSSIEQNFVLNNTNDVKMWITNYFDWYESNISNDKGNILYKMVILFVIFVHNYKRGDLSGRKGLWNNGFIWKNVELVVYEWFNVMIENDFDYFKDNEKRKKCVEFLIGNSMEGYIGLYKVWMWSAIKYGIATCEGDRSVNVIVSYIREMFKWYDIDCGDMAWLSKGEELEEKMKMKLRNKGIDG